MEGVFSEVRGLRPRGLFARIPSPKTGPRLSEGDNEASGRPLSKIVKDHSFAVYNLFCSVVQSHIIGKPGSYLIPPPRNGDPAFPVLYGLGPDPIRQDSYVG